jgi:hypothetical protein
MMTGMEPKTGTFRGLAPAGLLAACLLLLGGCGEPGVWAWTAPRGHAHPGPARAADETPPAVARAADAGVLVFPNSAFVADDAPEASRRDGEMAVVSRGVLPDRLAWPREARPDLRRTDSFRASTRAERWVFPETRRDYPGRRYPVYPVYPPYRGW